MNQKSDILSAFHNLVNSGRSGLVALYGDPADVSDLHYWVYFDSLGTTYVVHGDVYSEYFDADAESFAAAAAAELEERRDHLSLAELGTNEQAFLGTALADLLWHMVHDDGETTPDLPVTDPAKESFTIFGSGDLETDIQHFHDLLVAESDFSVAGQGFSLSTGEGEDGRPVCHLNVLRNEFFVDETTGEDVPVIIVRRVLECYDWRTLYAQMRALLSVDGIR